jgi:hypothetical protein
MVTTPKPKPQSKEHNDVTCLCKQCKAGRAGMRKRGHYAPEPGWPRTEHPNLEAEIAEMYS